MTYSSSSSVNRQRYSQRNKNTISFIGAKESLGPISNTVVVILLACLIGLIYLTQVAKTNSYSYEIDRLQQRQAQLKEDQKDLDLTAARLRSVDSKSVAEATKSLANTQPTATLD